MNDKMEENTAKPHSVLKEVLSEGKEKCLPAADPEEALRLRFIEDLKTIIVDPEKQKLIRITPQGAFISENFQPQIVEGFLKWSEKQENKQVISEAKAWKKLFENTEPEQTYLIEGKSCLVGSLIKCRVQEPQKYKLDYYLGTPLSTADYLHPLDPVFEKFKGVEAEYSGSGIEIQIKVGRREYSLMESELKEFRILAESSSKIIKRYPEAGKSLRGALKVLIKLLNRMQYVKKGERLLVPTECEDTDKWVILRLGTFVAVTDISRKIHSFYELEGRNFYRMVREECSRFYGNVKKRKSGSLEIMPRKHRFPAVIKAHGKTYSVNVQAVKHVADRIVFSHSLHKQFSGHYTIWQCLEYMSSQFERATEIDRRMISRHVEKFKDKNLGFRIFERWIFVVNKDGVILFSVDKTEATERKHSGNSHGHGRRDTGRKGKKESGSRKVENA